MTVVQILDFLVDVCQQGGVSPGQRIKHFFQSQPLPHKLLSSYICSHHHVVD